MHRLCLFLILLIACQAHAQEKEIVPIKFKMTRGSRLRQVLPFQNGFASIYGENDWYFFSSQFTVRFHDGEGHALRERKVILKHGERPAYLLSAFAFHDKLTFVCAASVSGERDMEWYVVSYDYSNDKFSETLAPVATNAFSVSSLLNGETETIFSNDSTYAAVCLCSETGSPKEINCNAFVFNRERTSDYTVQSGTLNPGSREKIQTLLDDAGELYIFEKTYNGMAEIKNDKPNYVYTLHRVDRAGLQTVCSLPATRLVRSAGGTVANGVFLCIGLIADTTLTRYDSLYTFRFNLADGTANERVAAMDPAIVNTNVPHFSNSTQRIDQQLVTVFEQREVVYDESAKASGGFAYERGGVLVVAFDPAGNIAYSAYVTKKQRFDRTPSVSFFVFKRSGSLYGAYPEQRRGSARFNGLVLQNLANHTERLYPFTPGEWRHEQEYFIVRTTNAVVFVQPRSRFYRLFALPLP